MKDKNKITLVALLVMLIMTAFPSFSQCDSPLTYLGKDTVLCENSSLILDAGIADNYLWSDGSEGQTLEVTSGGTYWVQATNDCGSTRDTVVITLVDVPELTVDINTDRYYCKGEMLDLNTIVENPVTSNIYTIERTDNSTIVTNIDTSGNYLIRALDENKCEATRDLNVEFQYPYEEEQIALVTYDKEEDKNIVVWHKTAGKRTMEYMLYNGVNTSDIMGLQEFDKVNQMVDYSSEPHAESVLYNLMLKDSCENQTDWDLKKAHKTMHLDVYTNAENQMELNWERYIGFDYDKYYIYRGTTADKLEALDSVVHNRLLDKTSFVDNTAEVGIDYYYQIIINTPETIYLDDDKKASAGPYVHSLSNLEDNRLKGTGINEMEIFKQNIKIYPNPFSDYAQISFRLNQHSELMISVKNLLGKTLYTLFDGPGEAGINNISMGEANEKLCSGIYFIQFDLKGSGSYCTKIIKN